MYKVEFTQSAQKEIRDLFRRDRRFYIRVCGVLDDLAHDPFQGKKLKGALEGKYSTRVGVYRLIYCVRQRTLTVIVLDLGHRREVYIFD